MRKGKMVAQGCHASMAVFFNRMQDNKIKMTEPMEQWSQNSFTKICVYVNSEQELLEIFQKAQNLKIPSALITDAGKTEFNGVPTVTCCAIGPDYEDVVDNITGNLPLL